MQACVVHSINLEEFISLCYNNYNIHVIYGTLLHVKCVEHTPHALPGPQPVYTWWHVQLWIVLV